MIEYNVKVFDDHEEWYYLNGNRYKIIYNDGHEEYFKNDVRHRDDGPAIKKSNGDEYWIVNGVYHRIDGPAIVEKNYKAWYINGKHYTEEEFNKLNKCIEKDLNKFKINELNCKGWVVAPCVETTLKDLCTKHNELIDYLSNNLIKGK